MGGGGRVRADSLVSLGRQRLQPEDNWELLKRFQRKSDRLSFIFVSLGRTVESGLASIS